MAAEQLTPQSEKKYMLKIPVQKRSRETVASIVESCSRLLVQEPYHAITTDKIAEMAGVSIGSLYQFFANKEAIVAAVIDDLLQDDLKYIQEKVNTLHGLDLDTKINTIIELGFDRYHDNRPLRAALMGVQGMLDYWDTRRVFFSNYQKALMTVIPDLPGRDKELVTLIVVGCFNNILQLALSSDQSPEKQNAVRKECTTLLTRYLSP